MKKEVSKSRLHLHLQTSMTTVESNPPPGVDNNSSVPSNEFSPADEDSLAGDFEKLSMALNGHLEGQNSANVKEDDTVLPTAPKWFSSYMEKMQEDLRTSIHLEVKRGLREALKDCCMWRASANACTESPDLLQDQDFSSGHSVRPKKAATTNGTEPLHWGITCDHCEQPVSGIRFKCGNCVDYDLCEYCEGLPGVHQADHVFLKIRRPTSMATCRQKGELKIPLLRHLYPQLGQGSTQGAPTETVFRCRKREKKVKRWLSHAENFFTGHLGQERRCHRSSLLNASRSVSHPLGSSSQQALHSRHGPPQSKIQGISVRFMTEVSPSGALVVQPGQEFEKEWKVRNDSQEPFSASYRLRFSWGSLMPLGQVEVGVPPLWPGETGTVGPVRFRAPQQEGTYHSHWLLVSHPGGMPFPWPSLSCPVHVSRQKELMQDENKENDTGIDTAATSTDSIARTSGPGPVPLARPSKEDCDAVVQTSSASNNNTTGPEESDDTASILSISSCDSDDDYVKVQGPTQLGFSNSTLLTKRHVGIHSPSAQGESQATSSSSIDLLSDMPLLEEETGQRQQQPHPVPESLAVQLPPKPPTKAIPINSSSLGDSCRFPPVSEMVSQETGAPEEAEFNNNNHRPPVEIVDRAERFQHSRSDHVNRQEMVIPVLPEGLVTGALTAAASVYNTAKALISNLQPPVDGHSFGGERGPSQPTSGPPGPMSQLIEMGFHDRELNQRLLTEKGGHMEDVVAELIRLRPDHSLHID